MLSVRNHWSFILIISMLPVLFIYNNCSPSPANIQGVNNSSNGNGGGSGGLDGNGGDSGGLNGGGTIIPADATEGEVFFLTKVIPKMNSASCTSCHSEPRFGGTAPLTVFNYDLMLLKLSQGGSTTNNAFINKPLGSTSHSGGNQCANGPLSDPCKTFVDWAKVEFPTLADGISGSLTALSSRGKVSGWAVDPKNLNAILQVHIYVDGPVNSGIYLGTATASEIGSGGSKAGHYFNYQLPEAYTNGSSHSLYIYGDTRRSY